MDIQQILNDHALWIIGNGGQRADLSGADLSGTNLSGTYLSHADLSGADLSQANLSGTNLSGTNLSDAVLFGINLSRANLAYANLSGADLSHANLSRANLAYANLYYANLSHSDLSGIKEFTPTMILLAQWFVLSDTLTSLAMAFDASAHHDPDSFNRWAQNGACPYADVSYRRVCNFCEQKKLWDPAIQTPRAWDLMVALIREKCRNSDWH